MKKIILLLFFIFLFPLNILGETIYSEYKEYLIDTDKQIKETELIKKENIYYCKELSGQKKVDEKYFVLNHNDKDFSEVNLNSKMLFEVKDYINKIQHYHLTKKIPVDNKYSFKHLIINYEKTFNFFDVDIFDKNTLKSIKLEKKFNDEDKILSITLDKTYAITDLLFYFSVESNNYSHLEIIPDNQNPIDILLSDWLYKDEIYEVNFAVKTEMLKELQDIGYYTSSVPIYFYYYRHAKIKYLYTKYENIYQYVKSDTFKDNCITKFNYYQRNKITINNNITINNYKYNLLDFISDKNINVETNINPFINGTYYVRYYNDNFNIMRNVIVAIKDNEKKQKEEVIIAQEEENSDKTDKTSDKTDKTSDIVSSSEKEEQIKNSIMPKNIDKISSEKFYNYRNLDTKDINNNQILTKTQNRTRYLIFYVIFGLIVLIPIIYFLIKKKLDTFVEYV